MSITREKWTQCRADYVSGKGSLAVVAARHGLRKGSVEKRARREDWTGLRGEFEAAQLAKLIPPPPPNLPPAPVAPDGAVSEAWLRMRQELFYRANAALLDKARKLLDARMTNGEELDTDELARLTTALSAIIAAESQLLGLRDRGKRKRRDAPRRCPQPEPIPDDVTTATGQ